MNRRGFLKAIVAAGAAPLMPGCFSSKAYLANGKIRLAAIGVGCQAWYDIVMLMKTGHCEIVALCDTDMGAKHTEAALKTYPDVPRFRDFRQMFDKMADSIDAVLVGTPDHSHFCAVMHAIKLGKAVYVEKPLAHSFVECELLAKAEKKYGAICQMGNQGHSGDNYFQYRDYYAKGMFRDVVKIVSHMNNERRWHRWGGKVDKPVKENVPSTLDWDSWLSSAEEHDYSSKYMIGEWRCWYDFGMGCMGDWGAHILDTVHRFTLQSDLPEAVEISNITGFNNLVFPIQNTVTLKFGKSAQHNAIDIEWWEGLHNQPKPPAGYRYDSNKGLFPESSANDGMIEPKLRPGKEIYLADGAIWQGLSHSSPLKRVDSKEPVPEYQKAYENHWMNFVRAVKGETVVNSPFAVAAPLSQLFCLGVVAQRLGRGFKFNPKTKRVIGDAEADRLLSWPPPRKGWEQYYKI